MQTVMAHYLSPTGDENTAASPITEYAQPDYESMSPQALARLMVFGSTESGAALFDSSIFTQVPVQSL